MLTQPDLHQRCQSIRLLLLDVDGVLSDGKLYYTQDNKEFKTFNTLDGHGIKMLMSSGVDVGIITGRESPMVKRRAQGLGITLLIQGREDKYSAMQELLETSELQLDQIAFMGDDWPDLTVMTKVHLALSVPNAHIEVKRRAHWISQSLGGHGAVREACDLIMQAQQTYADALAKYIN